MIFNFPILREYEAPCVPYPTAYLEGMHKWFSRERFAWFPRRLHEYEERSSVMLGGIGHGSQLVWRHRIFFFFFFVRRYW